MVPAGLEPATSRFATVCSHPAELRNQKQGSGLAGIRTRVSRVQTEDSPAEIRAHETQAAGGTRTRMVLSGAQVPHLSATAAKTFGTARAPGRVRTDGLRFTKPALLQLSYKGMAGRQGVEPCALGFGVQAAPGARPTNDRYCVKCRPPESNRVLLLFRQAREPSTPGRQTGAASAPAGNRTQFTW